VYDLANCVSSISVLADLY